MRKVWTNFNNVLMYISMVAGFIAVPAFSFLAGKNWWVVVLVGTLAVFLIHALWGMLIEMSKNIIKLGSDNVAHSDMSNENKAWNCPVCMSENSAINNFCEKCGSPRNNSIGGDNS